MKMRTEKEMMELILGIAQKDDRILAVYMNGSRTNPNVPKDIFQDYDIVYVVTETKPFIEDKSWIDQFGPRLYMQQPDKIDLSIGKTVDFAACYGWLIQFADGNRLDLHVEPLEKTNILEDKLCKVLLDKKGVLPKIPPAADGDYYVKKPSPALYEACVNEFWWCLNNVAKGLWREEIPYVQDMLALIRKELIKMLSWLAGCETEFSVSVGKSGKYLYRWLSKEDWRDFLKTYASGETMEIWEAVMVMCGLFDRTAKEVGKRLGYSYDEKTAEGSWGWLKYVRQLSKDAEGVC